jgi:hypothetical protein
MRKIREKTDSDPWCAGNREQLEQTASINCFIPFRHDIYRLTCIKHVVCKRKVIARKNVVVIPAVVRARVVKSLPVGKFKKQEGEIPK